MEKRTHITATPDPTKVPASSGNTPSRISITTDRFPVWMRSNPARWIVSTGVIIALVTMLGLGWTAYTVQQSLIQSSGHRLVQMATDAADKLDMMIQERYRDIQLLSTIPMAQGQNLEALTRHFRELEQAHPVYRWIGVTDSHGRIVAATSPSSISSDQSQRSWFRQARTLTGARILDVPVNEEYGETTAINVIAPLHGPDGKFLGAIAAVVSIPSLMNVIDDTVQLLKNTNWTEWSHIEYLIIKENGDLIADSTLHNDGNLKQLGLPSATLVRENRRGFVEEIHPHRGVPVITAYAQLVIPQADPVRRWGILIHVDRNGILSPLRSFLRELAVLAILILLPLLALVVGMIKTLHEEWNTTKREFQRASDAEMALKKRTEALHALIVAVQSLAIQQDLDGLLRQFVQLAKENTGARYAALRIYDGNTRGALQFLTTGTDEAAARAIQLLPFDQISQESLGQGDGVHRLTHLTAHWVSIGFPADHAPMTSFLGVPIRCHGQFFGHLSLANKAMPQGLADDFSEQDEQVVLTLASQAGTAIQSLQLLHDSKEQATHDSLTGLLNHSTTSTALTQELSRAERSHQPLAVLVADLDHFKRINDTYGHPVGDAVLREAAKRLRETARRYDHVGRIGGEEFLIVVPNCDLDALRECAERFRMSISDLPFDTPSGPLSITVSIGAAIWSSEYPLNSEYLHKMADYALYRVKSRGRNGIDIISHPLMLAIK